MKGSIAGQLNWLFLVIHCVGKYLQLQKLFLTDFIRIYLFEMVLVLFPKDLFYCNLFLFSFQWFILFVYGGVPYVIIFWSFPCQKL